MIQFAYATDGTTAAGAGNYDLHDHYDRRDDRYFSISS